MRRGMRNRKDTGDEEHDGKNKTARRVHGLSEKVRGDEDDARHNFAISRRYPGTRHRGKREGVGRGREGTHLERRSQERIDVTFRGQCIRY